MGIFNWCLFLAVRRDSGCEARCCRSLLGWQFQGRQNWRSHASTGISTITYREASYYTCRVSRVQQYKHVLMLPHSHNLLKIPYRYKGPIMPKAHDIQPSTLNQKGKQAARKLWLPSARRRRKCHRAVYDLRDPGSHERRGWAWILNP